MNKLIKYLSVFIFSFLFIFIKNNINVNAATIEKSAKITDYAIGYFSGAYNGQVVVFNAPDEIDDISNINSIHIEYTVCDTRIAIWCLKEGAIKEKTFTKDSIIGEYDPGFSWLDVQLGRVPKTLYYDVYTMGEVSYISRTEFFDSTNKFSFQFTGTNTLITEEYSYYFIMEEFLNPYIKVITINYTSTTGDEVLWDVNAEIVDLQTLTDIIEYLNKVLDFIKENLNTIFIIIFSIISLIIISPIIKILKFIFKLIYFILKWTLLLPFTLLNRKNKKVKAQKDFNKKLQSYNKVKKRKKR